MNQRENFFAMLNGKNPEFVPCTNELFKTSILATGAADQPWAGGMDPFGVNWIGTKEGTIPQPNKFMFSEISDWKKYVKFPDIDSLGLEQFAATELADCNREEQVVNVYNVCGIYERMAAFMGFENTLVALMEDPDSCREFFDAFAQYKIDVINRMIDLYKPDIITYFDDLATARNLFMSPKTYREVIKPAHKKIVDAVTSRGVIFSQHTCGKCESIVDDYVEMGVRMWHSAQIMNDIESIQKKYCNRLLIEGGWDSSGPVGYIGATEKDICDEAVRCAKTYGKYKNYILLPVIMNEKGNSILYGDIRIPAMLEAFHTVAKY